MNGGVRSGGWCGGGGILRLPSGGLPPGGPPHGRTPAPAGLELGAPPGLVAPSLPDPAPFWSTREVMFRRGTWAWRLRVAILAGRRCFRKRG